MRLRAVEHDLIDAYVNGELTGDTLEGFRSQYLANARGPGSRGVRAGAARLSARAAASLFPRQRPRVPARMHAGSQPWPKWLLAAAAARARRVGVRPGGQSAASTSDVGSARRIACGARAARSSSFGGTEPAATGGARDRRGTGAREALAAPPAERRRRAARWRPAAGPRAFRRDARNTQLPQFAIPPGADTVVLAPAADRRRFRALRGHPQGYHQRSRHLAQRTPAARRPRANGR